MLGNVRIAGLFISGGHNFFGHYGREAGESPTISVEQVECVAGKGLMRDRFFEHKENHKGQVTFFEFETFNDLCRRFQVMDKSPGVFRRNIVTLGANLNDWIGKEFEIQGVWFEGTEEAAPCLWMNHAFCQGTEAAMKGRGGLRARILTDGMLRVDAK
jgi:MOSC domain-containing protein YiiM